MKNINLIYDCKFEEGQHELHVIVLASDKKTARQLALDVVKKEERDWQITDDIVPATSLTFAGECLSTSYNNKQVMAIEAAA